MAKKGTKQQLTWNERGELVVKYPTLGKSITVPVPTFPAVIQEAARQRGFKAVYEDIESGNSAQAKYDAVRELIGCHKAGEWSRERSGREYDYGIVLEALARLKQDVVRAQQAHKAGKLDDKTKEALKEYAGRKVVTSMIADIKAERARAAADAVEEEPLNIKL